ncbi:alpha/beta hydrolase [Kitasatospora sp. NPDC001683]
MSGFARRIRSTDRDRGRCAGAGRALAAAVAVLGASALTGCAPTGTDAPRAAAAPPAASTEPADRAELRPFYQQKLTWSGCGELECATLTVPMDYAQPQNGKTFVLPLARKTAADPAQRVGSLVFGPGGPGVSGVRHLTSGGIESFSKESRARFDVVGFDQRGVAGSKPAVDCTPADPSPGAPAVTPPGGTGGANADAPKPLFPRTDAERRAALADADRSAADCRARSGALLPHLGTLDAARDLDVLRAALGEDRLTYIGWSYSTYLGTVYAEQFPHRVRAMVLDAAVDPSLDWSAQALSSGRAFRKAVDDYADNCANVAGPNCPADTPDGIRTLVADLYAKVARRPLPVKGSTEGLDEATLHTAVTMSMYTPEEQWRELSEGLSAARRGDGTKLAAIARKSASLQSEGSDSPSVPDSSTDSTAPAPADSSNPAPRDNTADVLLAVNCLDVPHPTDPQAYWDVLDRAHQESGAFGASTVLAELPCRTWPAGPTAPHRVKADGLPPVLVVGTTGDAATPYEDARSLAAQLPGGMLLTFDGLGHTAYGRSNSCVTNAVDRYLIHLAPVPAGTSC